MLRHNNDNNNDDENDNEKMSNPSSPLSEGEEAETSSMFMEKVVALRMESNEYADRKLAEELYRQQLEERIQQIQSQLQQQEQQQTSFQQPKQQPSIENTNDEKRFFARAPSHYSIITENVETTTTTPMPPTESPPATPSPTTTTLEEQDTVTLLNKVVATRSQHFPVQHPDQQEVDEEPTTSTAADTISIATASQQQQPQQFPGAVRVRGIDGNPSTDFTLGVDSQGIPSAEFEFAEICSGESIAAVQADIEQARIRQEIIEASPQVRVVVDAASEQNKNANVSGVENTKRKYLVGFAILLLAAGIVVIVLLTRPTSDGEKSVPPATSPPTNAPTEISTDCPCSYETDGQPVAACGLPSQLTAALQEEGQVGLGLCFRGSCSGIVSEQVMALEDVTRYMCFTAVRTSSSETANPLESVTMTLFETDEQAESCEVLLTEKCEAYTPGIAGR